MGWPTKIGLLFHKFNLYILMKKMSFVHLKLTVSKIFEAPTHCMQYKIALGYVYLSSKCFFVLLTSSSGIIPIAMVAGADLSCAHFSLAPTASVFLIQSLNLFFGLYIFFWVTTILLTLWTPYSFSLSVPCSLFIVT